MTDTRQKPNALAIDPRDNVAVALEAIETGAAIVVAGRAPITARQTIPFAHKAALRPMARGEAVLKYGAPIGFATRHIEPGDWVHSHNAKSYFAARREEVPR